MRVLIHIRDLGSLLIASGVLALLIIAGVQFLKKFHFCGLDNFFVVILRLVYLTKCG